jgi:Lipase (class 3)
MGRVMTPEQLCAASAAAYTVPASLVVAGDVHVVLSEIGGVSVVAFRGTEPRDAADWLRDFDAVPMLAGPLGVCHRGFLTGAQAALAPLLLQLPHDKPVAVTGHSLGGAMAICLTALLVVHGVPPVVCTTFGAPAVSVGESLPRLIAGVPGARYRCGDDPVPMVPVFPFVQDRALAHIGHATLDPIADHMIDRYQAALVSALAA